MRRKLLLGWTVVLMVAGLVLALTPFAHALKPNIHGRNDGTLITTLAMQDIKAGELQSIRVGNHNLFIFRPTPAQWQGIHRLDGHVWNPDMPAWNPQLGAFFYWGYGTHHPYTLVEKPKQASYQEFPHRWGMDEPDRHLWEGGYLDANGDMSYDYAGRAIRDLDYTRSGYSMDVPNLQPAHVERISPQQIAVGPYQLTPWSPR